MVMEGTTLNNSMNKKQIHFYTYGDSKKYKVSKKHLIHLAKLSGLFDKLYSFSLNDVPKIEKYPYNLIFNYDRGGGYWVWKYLILEKLIKNTNEVDIIVYFESGSSFNYNSKHRFIEYIYMLIFLNLVILEWNQKNTILKNCGQQKRFSNILMSKKMRKLQTLPSC